MFLAGEGKKCLCMSKIWQQKSLITCFNKEYDLCLSVDLCILPSWGKNYTSRFNYFKSCIYEITNDALMGLWTSKTGNKAIPFCHVPVMELVFVDAVKIHFNGLFFFNEKHCNMSSQTVQKWFSSCALSTALHWSKHNPVTNTPFISFVFDVINTLSQVGWCFSLYNYLQLLSTSGSYWPSGGPAYSPGPKFIPVKREFVLATVTCSGSESWFLESTSRWSWW